MPEIIEFRHQETIQADRVEIARRQLAGPSNSLPRATCRGSKSAVGRTPIWPSSKAKARSQRSVSRKRLNYPTAERLQQLPIATAAERREDSRRDCRNRDHLKEIEGRRGYQLRAPIAGRVSALQAWVGKIADPKMPALSIVPEGDILEAELLVPARAIGFIAAGQTVQISYDTFPFQQFGFARGNVRTVSRTLLKPDEIVGPTLLREPSYRVERRSRAANDAAYGDELPLEPDLQLQADIVVRAPQLARLDPRSAAQRWERS